MLDPFPPPPALLVRLITPLAHTLSLSTLPLHIHEILFSWAGYHVLSSYVSPFLSARLFPRIYGPLDARTKVNWDVRVVSFLQACLINSAALYVIFRDDQRGAAMDWRARIWGYSGAGGAVQALAAGYFLWDLEVSVRYLRLLGPESLAHAVSALVVTFLGFRPFANYYGLNFVLYELSTPSLNIHWFLDKLGLTGSTLQLYNGLTLIATFFGCRVLWGNYQSLRIYADVLTALRASASSGAAEVPLTSSNNIITSGALDYQHHPDMRVNVAGDKAVLSLPMWLVVVYLGSNTLLNGLNLYWFGKMVQAVARRFEGPKGGRAAEGKGKGKGKEGNEEKEKEGKEKKDE